MDNGTLMAVVAIGGILWVSCWVLEILYKVWAWRQARTGEES
jgi:hypothetical protein